MVIHIALFKWKDGVSLEAVETALQDVRSLKQKISGIEEIYCGENYSPWSEGFTHAVVVIAEDQKSLDAYRNHPDHQDVAQRIENMEQTSLGVDFMS